MRAHLHCPVWAFPPPTTAVAFEQCLGLHVYCNEWQECWDNSDEELCGMSFFQFVDKHKESVPPPAVLQFIGNGSYFFERMTAFSHCPDTHFQCPDGDYCLPVYVRCNDVFDCPNKEDERDCNAYTCPGFYRCRAVPTCLHVTHVCDGWPQCPQHDDETFCNLTCPTTCTCYGHAYHCARAFLPAYHPDLRYANVSESGMHTEDFRNNSLLILLSVARCGIMRLGNSTFHNVRSLDLSYNLLNSISFEDLEHFSSVTFLALTGNPLQSFFRAEAPFRALLKLDLSHVEFKILNPEIFRIFENLQSLNLSQSGVQTVTGRGFPSLRSLKELDLQGCPLTLMPRSLFMGLESLSHVTADNYKVCCPAMLPAGSSNENCVAPFDEISSCDALLRSDVYRASLAVFAVLACVGNALSFAFRLFILKNKHRSGFAVFVSHLCLADFLMGVYLVLIGGADRLYLDSYLWEEVKWKSSASCKIAGFLSLLSSEMSAEIICIITLDRFLALRFPFSRVRFQRRSAQLMSAVLWVLGVVLAALPLLPVTSHWMFYSQTGICLPLPVTRQDFPGHAYAFGVMIVFNFILFLFIATGQMFLFVTIHTQSMVDDRKSIAGDRKSKDLAVAQRLIVVVASDFLCWFPIGLLGMLASRGVPVPGEVNVGMAIFVLPLNSALNPFLYSLNSLRDRRRRAKEEALLKMITSCRKDRQ